MTNFLERIVSYIKIIICLFVLVINFWIALLIIIPIALPESIYRIIKKEEFMIYTPKIMETIMYPTFKLIDIL